MSAPLLISRQELVRTYGFSANLVEELGSPDHIRANPRWGYTYFYDLERVEVFAAEHVERIARILEARPRRQERARAVIYRRRAETMEWSRTVPLVLEPIPPHALEQARRYFAPAPFTRERALLYLRLHYSNYLECVQLASRRSGAAESRLIFCERIETMLEAVLQAQGV